MSRSFNTHPDRVRISAVLELRRSGAAGTHKSAKHSPKGGRNGQRIAVRREWGV